MLLLSTAVTAPVLPADYAGGAAAAIPSASSASAQQNLLDQQLIVQIEQNNLAGVKTAIAAGG